MDRTIVTGDGCAIAYRFDGPADAPVLLLSNSLGTSMAMWEPQMAAWTPSFRVLRYDQRGHGASDAPPGAYSLDRLGRDVIELLDALDLDVVDFCGLSLGGMVGQWMGIRAGARLRRLVLANTSGFMGPPDGWDARIDLVRRDGLAVLAQASVGRWFTPDFAAASPDVVDPVVRTLGAIDPVGYAGCCAAIRDMDLRGIVDRIAVPTLVIGGTQDLATPPAHTRALHDTIPGSQLVWLEAAHLSSVERPGAFADAVSRFLLAA